MGDRKASFRQLNIALLVIGLILGAGGGFIASFVTNQQKINLYEQQNSELKLQISSLSFVRNYGDVSIEQAKELVEKYPWLLILDVRTMSEFQSGHIEEAMNIPIDELQTRIGELNKSIEIIVYCGSGHRSSQAIKILVDNGFIGLYNMADGIGSWVQAGYSTTRES